MTDGRTIACSEREHEFTFAKNYKTTKTEVCTQTGNYKNITQSMKLHYKH